MLGVSCTQFGLQDPEKVMDMVSTDFGLWEIFSEGENDITNFFSRFDELKASYDLKYSVHAPISDINIAALNERIRETSIEEMLRTMDYANRMGIETVTIHPGVYSFVLHGVKERSEELAKDSLKKIEKGSMEYGVTAAVENMPSFAVMMGQLPKDLFGLIEGTDLKICFDVGHANTMEAIDEFIEVFGERIANVHIHDNMGDTDTHMTIGDGNIDFARVFSKLNGYKGNFVIESRNMGSAVLSKKRLGDIMRRHH
ncbi:MAG: sugar phosphate isomerase/epimerase [Candidatus Methanoplasma sp.]|jgi:sugar phosphate isomerase/epimerase|nr:sugar phosphate isomerase/epimerase [Candidatus Methanoplasma sp.]